MAPINGSGNSSGYTPPVSGNNGGITKKPKKDKDNGHDYTNLDNQPNPICLDLSWINCTQEEAEDYLSRFQYPGQWPGSPVEDRGTYDVFPASLWGIPTPICYIGMCDSGAIRVRIDDNPLIITNVTRSTHIFHTGYVERKGFQATDGNWYVSTHGQGTNDGYGFIPGPLIDNANQAVGPYAFEAIDYSLIIYTTVVETGQYISTLLP